MRPMEEEAVVEEAEEEITQQIVKGPRIQVS